MLSEDLISVIVPVYNSEAYLDRCVKSIINQTYKNLEIILIDDGSTDSSGDICDFLKEQDNRIRVFHTKNFGMGAARNLGLEKANGSYIGFVDSDDQIDKKMFKILLKNLCDTNSDLSICSYALVYKNTLLKTNRKHQLQVIDNKRSIQDFFFTHSGAFALWNKLFVSSLFDNVKFPEGKIYEDANILFKIFDKCKKVAYDDRELYLYTQRKNSIMYSITKAHAQDWFELIDTWYNNKSLVNFKEEIAMCYLRLCKDMKARLIFSNASKDEKNSINKILDCGIKNFVNKNEISSKTYRKAIRILKYPWLYVPKRWFAESGLWIYILLKKVQYKRRQIWAK